MRGNYWIISFSLLLVTCRKASDHANTKVLGHAGSGLQTNSALYHDNSLESIQYALDMNGCEGVEIDLQLSASKDLWLFHNPQLAGETGGSGCIRQHTHAQLQELKYKSLHREKLLPLAGLPWERLQQKTLLLDLRHYSECTSEFVPVSEFIAQFAAQPQLSTGGIETMLLLSTDAWVPALENSPFQLIYCGASYEECRQVLAAHPFDGLMLRSKDITREQVEEMHEIGKKVIIFEVRSAKGARKAFRKAPDYLVTDDLEVTIIEK
jgi:glycerophosphoryl diester phosphodiesterase